MHTLTIALDAPRHAPILSSWADITCGEACWHAREDICRCSCGGVNHGCLRTADGVRPVRTSKIAGERYELAAVGLRRDVIGQAAQINGAQYRSVEKATFYNGGIGSAFWNQYYYTWSETDEGAPARVKYATADQLAKWPELAGYRGNRDACLLWKIITMPAAPTIARVDKETGEPLAWQCPNDKPSK